MRRLAVLAISLLISTASFAGETEVKAAQSSIEAQLRAFQSGDSALAYSYAAPNITRMFPTVDAFMGMVTNGYQPLAKPRNFAFGKVEEAADGRIAQELLLVGPDGKDYRALYVLERQPDGMFRIVSVSLRATNALST